MEGTGSEGEYTGGRSGEKEVSETEGEREERRDNMHRKLAR